MVTRAKQPPQEESNTVHIVGICLTSLIMVAAIAFFLGRFGADSALRHARTIDAVFALCPRTGIWYRGDTLQLLPGGNAQLIDSAGRRDIIPDIANCYVAHTAGQDTSPSR